MEGELFDIAGEGSEIVGEKLEMVGMRALEGPSID